MTVIKHIIVTLESPLLRFKLPEALPGNALFRICTEVPGLISWVEDRKREDKVVRVTPGVGVDTVVHAVCLLIAQEDPDFAAGDVSYVITGVGLPSHKLVPSGRMVPVPVVSHD